MFSKDKWSKQLTLGNGKSVPSIIAEGLQIDGNLSGEGEIQIDGNIEGDVKGELLLVGPTARVTGMLDAESVIVHGTVEGKITARDVTLSRSARMIGDIMSETLAIEQGAFIEGHCRKLKPETKRLSGPHSQKSHDSLNKPPKPAADIDIS